MKSLNYEYFDILTFLEDHKIEFFLSGKNIGSGWVGIPCPFCEDLSTHLGINLETKAVNCWKCGSHNLRELIQELLELSFTKVDKIITNYSTKNETSFPINILPNNKPVIPSYFTKLAEKNNSLVNKFLEKRGVPSSFIAQYELFWAGNLGPFAGKLIIPVKMYGEVVTYVGRDITGLASSSYKNAPKEKSLIPVKSCLYNFDLLIQEDKVVIVEGVIDAWKLGTGAVATFGILWTREQINLLKNKKPKKIIILFDSEPQAQESAMKLAKNIWFCPTEIIFLKDHKDPGDLTIKEGRSLNNILRGMAHC